MPRIAITIGEPAGIGPDITLQQALREHNDAQLIAVGDRSLLSQRATHLGLAVELTDWTPSAEDRPHVPGILPVLDCPLAGDVVPGELDTHNAAGVVASLDAAIDATLAGEFDALVTAPVQKSVIMAAGYAFTGHTEHLAQHTGTDQVVMMLAADELRVALATTHLPLADVPAAITPELLLSTLRITDGALRDQFGLPRPRIAVLGLNPHAGEDGHLGHEEIDTIIPALDTLRDEGLDLLGPLPADTAFNPPVLEQVDTVFALYHDQGLPVLKHSGFGRAVNITLGLPIVRTSVDHGTALDLAGTGRANADSLGYAIAAAIRLARHRTREAT